MLTSKCSVLVLATMLIGLLSVPLSAVAEHEESHKEDTLFSYAYDSINHFMAINLGLNDTLYECEFENGSLEATYGEADGDGLIPVETLEDVDGTKTFDPRPQDELAEGLTEADDPVDYSGADGECGVSGVVVAGPNGQINHGQFLKAAKSLIDIKGHGCLVRHLAQSDIGRTEETKVSTADADPEFEIGETGDLSFATIEADCHRGNKDKGPNAQAASNGRPESPGKSADAPGHDK